MTNQSSKDFRGYLVSRINSLQATHENLQKKSDSSETLPEQKDYLSSLAAGIWDRKVEMETTLKLFDEATAAEYPFQVTQFSFYQSIPSDIKVLYPNKRVVGFAIEKTPTDSLFFSLSSLLDMAEHMWTTGGISNLMNAEEGQEASATTNTETGA